MGRRFPSEENPLVHHYPALSISLLIAWIITNMAIIIALCSGRSKKSSPPKSPAASPSSFQSTESTQQPTSTLQPPQPLQMPTEKTQVLQEVSPLPSSSSPTTWTEEISTITPPQSILNTVTSRRKMRVSLSMKLPGALSKIRTGIEEHHKQRKEEQAPQESIWQKTIILGERCRVPREEDDDAIIYNERGNRVSVYQPKTARSLPVSRTSSYIDLNDLPVQQH